MRLFWEREGLRFFCTQCSHCCRHESGYVFVSQDDISSIATYLDLVPEEVISRYCVHVRAGGAATVSLSERENKDCVFWTDGGCSIYPARPVQCRTYPFWRPIVADAESWKGEGRSCPGIGVGPRREADAIRAAIVERQGNVPLVLSVPEADR